MGQTAIAASPDLVAWVVLPLLIFLARVTDVTLGTLRIIFVSRGRKRLAPLFGFFEVLIWIIALGQLVQRLDNVAAYVAYAAGFATGNYVGLLIEEKLAIGTLVVRVIVAAQADEMVARLHAARYGVTSVDAHGATGNVKLVYTIIKRKNLEDVLTIIHSVNPKAFLSVEEIRSAQEGIFPPLTSRGDHRLRLFPRREGK